jgi:polar amino acid transport system permease protein
MGDHAWFEHIGLILDGGLVTIELTFVASVIGMAAAFSAGLARLSQFLPIRVAARVYIEFFRGSSALVQLFGAYYLLPLIGIYLPALAAGAIVLGLNVGAYGAENVRSAILSVPREQIEACTVLNLGRWQSLRRVIIPQALPVLIPLFGNNGVELLKATSIVSLITIADLTFQAQLVRFQTGDTFGPFATILLIYFLLSLIIGTFASALFRKVQNRTTVLARVV